eukprot:12313231-Ditylum_brightwellii.AAC.1
MEEVDLSCTHNGVDIMNVPSSNTLCLGYIEAVQTKFCTCLMCSIFSHQTKHKHIQAGLYLKPGQNAVYCTSMLPADRIPGKQLASWLEEKDTPMGIWPERFVLSNAIHAGTRALNAKKKPVEKQQDDSDIIDNVALVKPVKVKVSGKMRKEWVVDHAIPANLMELIDAIE